METSYLLKKKSKLAKVKLNVFHTDSFQETQETQNAFYFFKDVRERVKSYGNAGSSRNTSVLQIIQQRTIERMSDDSDRSTLLSQISRHRLV